MNVLKKIHTKNPIMRNLFIYCNNKAKNKA